MSADTPEGSFELHLAQRQLTLTVPPERSILQVLQDAGVEVPFSCSEGICGTCLTRVKEGEPDHWDMYLTADEQAANDCFMPCISRSKSPVLVLDL